MRVRLLSDLHREFGSTDIPHVDCDLILLAGDIHTKLNALTQGISAAYASRLDDFILKHQPVLWVHGHIHHPVDYTLGQTRIVSNPQGYPGGEDRGFRPALTLDLPD